mmetsp:Transcript_13381/g.28901  ORF Transcript_13381/g.28901 Transcript_13381/m.28901 type:complete len:208 (-) Transcript_13381:4627-5250(-)
MVPGAALQEEAVEVGARLGLLRELRGVQLFPDVREELQRVDGDLRLAGVHLQGGCHEALGEEEARDPVAQRGPVQQPIRHELDAQAEVADPRVQRLEARVRDLLPVARHLLDEERVVHGLEVSRHQDDAADGLHEHLQASLDHADHRAEARVLLAVEDADGDDPTALDLHVGLRVDQRLRRGGVRDRREEVLRHLVHDLLGLLPAAA